MRRPYRKLGPFTGLELIDDGTGYGIRTSTRWAWVGYRQHGFREVRSYREFRTVWEDALKASGHVFHSEHELVGRYRDADTIAWWDKYALEHGITLLSERCHRE